MRQRFAAPSLILGGLAAAIALVLVSGTASAAHPIDARLRGTFTMQGRLTVAAHVYGEHPGQQVVRSWTFYPKCPSGSCARVVLKRFRSPKHILDTVTLTRRSAGVYVGKSRFWLALECAGARVARGGYANETITVRIVRAVQAGGTRYASTIRASYDNPSRYQQTRCPGGIGHDAAAYGGQLAATALAASPQGGYLILTADGAVWAFGKATLHGSDAGRLPARLRATRLAVDPATGGYWILKSNGGVDAFGAPAAGSLRGRLGHTSPAAIAAAPSRGYMILTSDGGVHAFGGAAWHGSDKGKLGRGVRAVALAVDRAGGYWILKSNGGVDGFGAPVAGSLKGKLGGATPVAIAAAPSGGYWILTSNGGVHPYGRAPWHGSDGGKLPADVSALSLAVDPVTGGYWILKSSDGIDGFGAPYQGSLVGRS